MTVSWRSLKFFFLKRSRSGVEIEKGHRSLSLALFIKRATFLAALCTLSFPIHASSRLHPSHLIADDREQGAVGGSGGRADACFCHVLFLF